MENSRLEKIDVLDHGYVRFIDSMGGDYAVVAAARQSYGEGTLRLRSDLGLVNYLLRNRHDSPFEVVELHLQLKVPIFVARQILRHRLYSVNEVSARYSILPEEYYVPGLDQICFQSSDNKQGRSGPMPVDQASAIQADIKAHGAVAFELYNKLIQQDLSRETARMVLPLNVYTTFGFKANLRTWLHFLHLRMDPHAQWETRQFANAASLFVKELAPACYAAWEEYVQNSVTIPRQAWKVLTRNADLNAVRGEMAMLKVSKGEMAEFEKKLKLAA